MVLNIPKKYIIRACRSYSGIFELDKDIESYCNPNPNPNIQTNNKKVFIKDDLDNSARDRDYLQNFYYYFHILQGLMLII